jgi:hypothetical protein
VAVKNGVVMLYGQLDIFVEKYKVGKVVQRVASVSFTSNVCQSAGSGQHRLVNCNGSDCDGFDRSWPIPTGTTEKVNEPGQTHRPQDA